MRKTEEFLVAGRLEAGKVPETLKHYWLGLSEINKHC